MTDYSRQIDRIKAAKSLDELGAVANSFPAEAQGEGGILYSGKVGNIPAEAIAKELAHKTGLPIINDTPRAQFLSYEPVKTAIQDSARRIFEEQGLNAGQSKRAGLDFLYGDTKAPPESPFSVENSLWGQASREFTASVRGPVTVVASAADAERVLGRVEVPTALQSSRITTLAGHPLSQLQDVQVQGGIKASLPEVQTQFIGASTKGIFVLPDNFGAVPSQVAISRELATTLHLDGSKFVGAQALSDAGFIRASVISVVRTATLAPAAEIAPHGGFSPHLGRGLGVLGAVTAAYDATTTAAHVSTLRGQGNTVGARSDIMHFGGRNLGALGGAAMGAEIFGTAGAETGPFDLLIGGAGAIGGAIVGDKLADAYDRHRIYNQSDTQGITWNYDPSKPQQGWTRDVPALPDTPQGQHFSANPALADRLTFQANNTAVDLALAHAATPSDPYMQAAGAHDTPSRIAAPWTRDAQTRQWSRLVTDRVLEHGLASTHVEQADPLHAAQLDAAAEQTITANLAGSRRGMAEHYQAMYEQHGWARYGAMPEAVTHALHAPTNILQASDGNTYSRGADGQWSTPGVVWGTNAAEGHVRNELDATRPGERSAVGDRAVRGDAHALRPFSDPDHPQHALFNKLQEVFPSGTSDARLHQATAACCTAGITHPRQLTGIVGHDDTIYFRSNAPGSTFGQMDMTRPAPAVHQSMQQLQQHSQQQAQMMSQIHAQNAQIDQQGTQGPALGVR